MDENGPVAAEGEEYVGTGLGGGGGGGGGGETVVESSKRLSRGGRYGVQKAPSDTKVRVPRVTKSPVEGRMRGQTA